MTMAERRFACTQCGRCCNRAPELELGEAAALADVFVLRLMLRIYSLPRNLADYQSENLPRDQASAEFYQSKRLLSSFAAASWPAKVQRGDKRVDYIQHLSLSVLPLDLGTGSCSALRDSRCGIYPRRPLSCRSVPLHYSRPEASAVRDLDAFTANPGFACDTGSTAPVVIAQDKIIDPAMRAARAAAMTQAKTDQLWKKAIVKAMKAGRTLGLPTLSQVEANAQRGALTTSMALGWQIAVSAGLMSHAAYRAATEAQASAILSLSALPQMSADTRQALAGMGREYAAVLD